MSMNAARKDFDALTRTIARGIKASVFVAIPATAGIFLIARPLVSAVFEHGQFKSTDTPIVAYTLVCYAVGLCGYFSQQIVTRAFYSMQDSKTPMKSAVLAVVVNIVLNLTLIWFMGTAGLALSTAICSYLQVAILVLALRRRLGHSILDGFCATLLKTIVAMALMALVGGGIISIMGNLPDNRWFNILRLAAVVPSAAAVYLLAAKLLRIEMLSLLTGAKREPSRAA